MRRRRGTGNLPSGHTKTVLEKSTTAEKLKKGSPIFISGAMAEVGTIKFPKEVPHLVLIDVRNHPIRDSFSTVLNRTDTVYLSAEKSVNVDTYEPVPETPEKQPEWWEAAEDLIETEEVPVGDYGAFFGVSAGKPSPVVKSDRKKPKIRLRRKP
jgi:hypothetical protein